MNRLVFSISIVLAMFTWSILNAQKAKNNDKSKNKLEAYQSVSKLIESGNFEFQAQKANPQRGRQVDLTTNPGYLKVNKGHVQADLPYLGVAQSASYSGNVGVKFDGDATSYKVNKNENKNKITVTFKISSEGESFNCSLTVSGNGDTATLYINSSRRDSISYYGSISELKE
jgi:hypothetical protein